MSKKLAFLYTLPLCLTACGPKPITISVPPPPAEWLQCQQAPERPDLAPLTTYAKPEVDARDLVIARYIIDLRAAYFDCQNQLGKVRDYYRSAE